MCTLDKLLEKQQRLPLPVAMLIIQDTCYIFKYINTKLISHKTINIENILITDRGEIKLTNIGTKDNYANSDEVTDIYALGIVLYKMLTGNDPYSENVKYTNPRTINKEIPGRICRVIRRMITSKSNKQYKEIDSILNITKKYLSHYDLHELRVQLVKVLSDGNENSFPQFKRNDEIKNKVRKIFFITALVLVSFGLLWNEGIIHKYLLRKLYSEVSVDLVIPKSISEDAEVPVHAYFYDNQNMMEIKKSGQDYVLKAFKKIGQLFGAGEKLTVERASGKNQIYSIKKVYLRNGDYSVKVNIGSFVWYKSFEVNDGNVNLTCDYFRNLKHDIKITTYAYDAESGKDITKSASFCIFRNGEWIPVERISENGIDVYGINEIRVRANNYDEKKYSVLIDWYQDEVIISASLRRNNLL